MICSRRGTVTKFLKAIWENALATTANWIPNGFLPKTVVWITAETTCALLAENILPLTLKTVDTLAENSIPLYRKLPLLGAITFVTIAARSSKVALSVIAVSLPLLLLMYSHEVLENQTSHLAGLIIKYLGGIFTSIGGGYLGLVLTHSTEVFSEYRFKMIEHALAGQLFEACVLPANMLIFKLPRLLSRTLIQMAVYNRKPLFHALRLSAKKDPNCGIICPALTKMLYARFQNIDTRSVADSLSILILPFFSKGKTPFFSAHVTAPLVKQQVESLQKNSGNLVNILSRSLIVYFSHPESYQETAQGAFLPASLNLIGESVIWHEENLESLIKLACSTLQKTGVFLMGHQIYPESHLESIENRLRNHLKPFICFTISKGLNGSISKDPLNEREDLQLMSIIHHILFASIIFPLMPKSLAIGLEKILRISLNIGVATIHNLQGFKPKTEIIDPSSLKQLKIDYFKPPSPSIPLDDYEMVD